MRVKCSVALVTAVVGSNLTAHVGYSQECYHLIQGMTQTPVGECESYTNCEEDTLCNGGGHLQCCGEQDCEAERVCVVYSGGCYNSVTGRCEDGQFAGSFVSGTLCFYPQPVYGCGGSGGGN